MTKQLKKSIAYLKFLNLVQALREMPAFPSIDPIEERLLNQLATAWHLGKKITVLEAMAMSPNAAPPFKVMVQTKNTTASGLQVNSMFLPISPTYVAGDVISKDMTGPNGGTWQNQKATVAQSGAINLVQMVSRNRFGTMVLRDWKY